MNTLILIVGDFIVFYIALFIALSVRLQHIVNFDYYREHLLPFTLLFIVMLFTLYMAGTYERGLRHTAGNIFNILLSATFFLIVTTITLFYFFPLFGLTPKTNLVLFNLFLFLFLFFWHFYSVRLFKLSYPEALLVGGSDMPSGYDIVRTVPQESKGDFILGTIANGGIKNILLNFNDKNIRSILPELHTLMLSGFNFINTTTIKEEETGKVDLSNVNESWLLESMQNRDLRLFLFAKRVIDVSLAVPLSLLYMFLLPFVALAIKLDSPGKVFVVQERLGQNRSLFNLYKFRTMTVDDDGYWHKGDQNVITRVGAFLRKSRIDELPQLWNVLRGDISLIGPRPDMLKFGEALAGKIDFYNTRYIVRPGLTGWAQCSQSVIPQSVSESRERLAYDLYYIKHLSIFLELKIILKTVKLLLKKIFT